MIIYQIKASVIKTMIKMMIKMKKNMKIKMKKKNKNMKKNMKKRMNNILMKITYNQKKIIIKTIKIMKYNYYENNKLII